MINKIISSTSSAASVDDATDSSKGTVELATTAETTSGTDAGRAVTPDGLKDGFQGATNITTLGTIATGTWRGSVMEVEKGGTAQTSYTTGDILYASGGAALSKLAASTDGHVLTSTGAGSAPAWEAAAGGSSMWNFSQGSASKATNDKWCVAHTTYGFQIGYIWSPTNIGAAGLMTSPHASLATNLFPWIVIPYDVTITGYRYDFSPAWNGEAHSFCLMQGTAVANGEETVWSAFDSVQTLADSVIDTSYAFYTMERTGLSISMGKGTRLCPAVRSSDGDTSTRSSYYWLNIYGTKD